MLLFLLHCRDAVASSQCQQKRNQVDLIMTISEHIVEGQVFSTCKNTGTSTYGYKSPQSKKKKKERKTIEVSRHF